MGQTAQALPAAAEVAVAGAPLPTYDHAPHESPPAAPPAYPAVSRNRSRCADAPCCSDPRSSESSGAHPPPSAACATECNLILEICVTVPIFHSTSDKTDNIRR